MNSNMSGGDLPETNLTVQAIYDMYKSSNTSEHRARVAARCAVLYAKAISEHERTHLGASEIGEECQRKIWYNFHQCAAPVFEGRILRLFQRGHLEEATLIEDLRAIGVIVDEGKVDETTGSIQQYGFKDIGGHFAGSCDGKALRIPEAPKTWHLLEFKTANDKTWKKLNQSGVEVAQPKHFAQMQIYMYYLELKRALYLSVNKNSDHIYQERVKFNKKIAQGLIAKAKYIIESTTPPEKMSEDPSFYKCKFCDFHEMCHYKKIPDVRCETCSFSTPVTTRSTDAVWTCNVNGASLNLDFRKSGCVKHIYIPDFLFNNFGKPTDCTLDQDTANTTIHFAGGVAVGNAPGDVTSVQLVEMLKK